MYKLTGFYRRMSFPVQYYVAMIPSNLLIQYSWSLRYGTQTLYTVFWLAFRVSILQVPVNGTWQNQVTFWWNLFNASKPVKNAALHNIMYLECQKFMTKISDWDEESHLWKSNLFDDTSCHVTCSFKTSNKRSSALRAYFCFQLHTY